MALHSCHRATCDAPGCTAAEMLPHARTEPCRGQLAALGWMMVWMATGAGQAILYLCPAHISWRPKKFYPPVDRDHLAATAWVLTRTRVSMSDVARILDVTVKQVGRLVEHYDLTLRVREQSAAYWSEPFAKRLRAAGAIP